MLIDGEKFLIFLDGLVEQAEINVADYEGFHGDRLANIPSMAPVDCFLYGIATGKLQQVSDIREMFRRRTEELDND